jgi:hypothetical protein
MSVFQIFQELKIVVLIYNSTYSITVNTKMFQKKIVDHTCVVLLCSSTHSSTKKDKK